MLNTVAPIISRSSAGMSLAGAEKAFVGRKKKKIDPRADRFGGLSGSSTKRGTKAAGIDGGDVSSDTGSNGSTYSDGDYVPTNEGFSYFGFSLASRRQKGPYNLRHRSDFLSTVELGICTPALLC